LKVPRAELAGNDLQHRYGGRVGLRKVSFAIASPGVVAIRGANGAGKSTLLRVLAGLLRPSHGRTTLRIDEREIPPADRRRWVGYAAPDLAFYLEFTVAENLHFAAETRGDSTPIESVRRALERVGLQSRATDRVAALSSGMLQRLRLAFALLHDPAVLLLDEPGSHLDEEGKSNFEQLVARERGGRLVVIATNEEREWTLADHSIELQGRGLGDPS
jgi:ABC-type multidrug transport system ATPase subunit